MDIVGRLNAALRRVPSWLVYLAGAAWAVWLFWLGATNQLGPEPINTLEREYGSVAIKLLIVTLAISPLRKLLGLNLIRFRRAISVAAFFFVLAHFTVWALLDVQAFDRIWADILKRPYITVGMTAFALLIPLAVTSNDFSVRKLGSANWRKLHLLTYPAAILAGLHYVWLVKGFQIEPLAYFGVILALLARRIRWNRTFGWLQAVLRRSNPT